jgi:hypothetical protein
VNAIIEFQAVRSTTKALQRIRSLFKASLPSPCNLKKVEGTIPRIASKPIFSPLEVPCKVSAIELIVITIVQLRAAICATQLPDAGYESLLDRKLAYLQNVHVSNLARYKMGASDSRCPWLVSPTWALLHNSPENISAYLMAAEANW